MTRCHGRTLLFAFGAIPVASSPALERFRPLESPGINAFEAWLQEGGAEASRVRLGEDAATGRRGIFAADNLEAGDVVLRVPHALILTADGLPAHMDKLCGSHFAVDVMNRQSQMAATLLLERAKGSESAWRPMIDVLPEDFDTPVWWSPEAVELLRGSALHPKVLTQQRGIDASYELLVLKCSEFGSRFSMSDWRWAVQAIGSRVFKLKSATRAHVGGWFAGMVPFADMANHHSRANTSWGFEDQADAFEVIAREDIPAGMEVFDSYGLRKDAEQLIMDYGFISSDGSDLAREGFAKALVQLPICLPPSLVDPTMQAVREEVFAVAHVAPCCDDTLDDEACFRQLLASDTVAGGSFFVLGKPAKGSQESENTQLARVLAHFRFFAIKDPAVLRCVAEQVPPSVSAARSFGEWTAACTEMECYPDSTTAACKGRLCPQLLPISKEVELEALRLLRALIRAHLAHLAQITVVEEAGLSSGRRAMVDSYRRAEQNTLRWHEMLVDFASPLLRLGGRRALKEAVCGMASTTNLTERDRLRDFGGYIDSVVAPLFFIPWPEDGQPCSVVHTSKELASECLRTQMDRGVDDLIASFRQKHGYDKEEEL